MGKGRSSSTAYKATQQRISAGMDIVTRVDGTPVPTKAELRASIPAYDESMVKRIETPVKGKRTPKR